VQVLHHPRVTVALILAQLADGDAGHLAGGQGDVLGVERAVEAVFLLRLEGNVLLAAHVDQRGGAVEQVFRAAGQGRARHIAVGECGGHGQRVVGDGDVVIGGELWLERLQDEHGLLFVRRGDAQALAVLMHGRDDGQHFVVGRFGGGADDHRIAVQERLLQVSGDFGLAQARLLVEEAVDLGDEQDAAGGFVDPGADGAHGVIQQGGLVDLHQPVQPQRAFALGDQEGQAVGQRAFADAFLPDEDDVAVDPLGEHVDQLGEQGLTVVDGALFPGAGQGHIVNGRAAHLPGDGRGAGRFGRAAADQAEHRFGRNPVLSQDAAGAQPLLAHGRQQVIGAHVDFVGLLGVGQGVIDGDDHLAGKLGRFVVTGDEGQVAGQVAAALHGQAGLAGQAGQVDVVAGGKALQQGMAGRVLGLKQGQQSYLREDIALAVASHQGRGVVQQGGGIRRQQVGIKCCSHVLNLSDARSA